MRWRMARVVSYQTPPPPPFLPQDPTVHPRWTGDASAVASEDGRLAKFARKYGLKSGGGGGTVGGGGAGKPPPK